MQNLAILLDAYAALVSLAENAGAVEVAVAARALDALAAQNPGAARAALRLRLTAAELLLGADRLRLATALMQPILDTSAPTPGVAAGGLDDTLLTLWRARGPSASDGSRAAALRTLSELLGADHPSVALWQR
jgi:hypothetical protein